MARFGHENVHQGYFAEGLVASIAAAGGLDVALPRVAERIDLMVFRAGPNGTSGSRQINLQVKSWSTGTVNEDGHFHYPLKVPAFNYLASSDHDVRHYLVLCLVPRDPTLYADAQHDQLKLSNAAYWMSLRDHEPNPALPADSSKTVLVPRSQLLTVDTMNALVDGSDGEAVVS